MPKQNEFNSKKELDNLVELFTTRNPTLPSETIKMFENIEDFIIGIHQLGYTTGYTDGAKIKRAIKNGLG